MTEWIGEHPLDKAARMLGGRERLARLLGVRQSAIGNWKVRGVPVLRCIQVEEATGGAVTREVLRPGDWRRLWPELAAQGRPSPISPGVAAHD